MKLNVYTVNYNVDKVVEKVIDKIEYLSSFNPLH